MAKALLRNTGATYKLSVRNQRHRSKEERDSWQVSDLIFNNLSEAGYTTPSMFCELYKETHSDKLKIYKL